jgi:RNA polymerase-binding transcription factor DksA
MAKKPAKKPAPKKASKPVKKPAKQAKQAPVGKAAPKKVAKVSKPSKPVAKKATSKKSPLAKAKPAPKKAAPKSAPKKATKVAKPLKPVAKKATGKKSAYVAPVRRQQFITKPKVNKNLKLTPFLQKQRKRLLDLKDTLLDSMSGVARGNLHAGSETSAFGMHQADAGSDAYDRDFALSMLSKEQGSLYEIDEALKRIEDGNYGICEICQKPIQQARLEALPFTRTTVDCQSELEKRQHHHSVRPHINSLFGLTEEEEEEAAEDEVTEG